MFYTNPNVMYSGCYARRQAAPCDPTAAVPTVAVLGHSGRATRKFGVVTKSSRSVSVQSIEFRMQRTAPKQQSSAIYTAFMDKPNYSTRIPMESAFPSMRNPRKPKSDGITIVNIHNNHHNDNTMSVPNERYPVNNKMVPYSEVMTRNNHFVKTKQTNKGVVYPRTECTQNTQEESSKRKKVPIPCLTTDQDRQRVFGNLPEPPILPYWHREASKSAKTKNYSDQYDCQQAKREWDRFYSQQTNEKKKSKPAYKDLQVASDSSIRVEIDDELPKKAAQGLPMAKDVLNKQKPVQNRMNSAPTEPVGHPCRPFYGTCEAARISQLAIGHLVKAESELRKLEFTAGTVLPHTKAYIGHITEVQEDLKQFNTNFREMQQRTDKTLRQKIGRNVTITVSKPPTGTTRFPSNRISEPDW